MIHSQGSRIDDADVSGVFRCCSACYGYVLEIAENVEKSLSRLADYGLHMTTDSPSDVVWKQREAKEAKMDMVSNSRRGAELRLVMMEFA